MLARTLTLDAPAGMVFVSGTGNPPRAPSTGYVRQITLDGGACGWLFVRAREGEILAVQPAGGSGEDPDGSRYVLLTYRTPQGGSVGAN